MGFFFLATQERVRNIRGKRASSVLATEVLLYFYGSNPGTAGRIYFWTLGPPFEELGLGRLGNLNKSKAAELSRSGEDFGVYFTCEIIANRLT